MDHISDTAAPYAAAILAAGTDNPSVEETRVIRALGLARVEHRHIAFAGWCRRMTAGEPAETIDYFRDPAREAGEFDAAMQAVGWLQGQGKGAPAPKVH